MDSRGPNPTITLAIATLGRFEELRDTLESILAGSFLPAEILISDQNVPPRPDIDDYLAKRSPLIRHIRTEPKGVVFNMNTLLRNAKGDVILFVDDDVVPSPNLVEAHLANYADPSIAGVAGRVEQPSGDLPPDEVDAVGVFHRWTGRMVFHFNGLKRQRTVFSQGANMSFDRRKLEAIGGFDEGFGGNGYFFESEAAFRLVKQFPNSLVFDPASTLKHLAAPRGGARVHDRAIHNAFVVRNSVHFYRRHCPPLVYPLLVLKLFAITLAKAVYRGSPAIAFRGIPAIIEGITHDSDRKSSNTVSK
jgi:glycosyltransferase involved in cell wall biosynthesis